MGANHATARDGIVLFIGPNSNHAGFMYIFSRETAILRLRRLTSLYEYDYITKCNAAIAPIDHENNL